MKQFLRLGDGYALMSTYDTEKKRLARGPLGIGFDTASEILHVSDAVYTPAGPPVSALSAEKSRNCRGEAAEKLAGLSEANQEACSLNYDAGLTPTLPRGSLGDTSGIPRVYLGCGFSVMPKKNRGDGPDIPAGCAPCIARRPASKPKTFAKFMAVFLALFMCLTAAMQVSAQEAEPADAVLADIKPLQIGDTIPEYLWHLPLQVVNHPEGKDTITLNDYRGKLIILDFWATWCGACVAQFPKMDSLLREHGQRFRVLPITTQSEDLVTAYVNRAPKDRLPPFPAVVEDTVWATAFPHRFLPHYVWLGKDGKVLAFTEHTALTAETIDLAWKRNVVETPMKHDLARVEIDYDQPLYENPVLSDAEPIYSSVLWRGYAAGLQGGHQIKVETFNEQQIVYGNKVTCINQPLVNLFIVSQNAGYNHFALGRNVEVRSKDKSAITTEKFGQEYQKWLAKGNGYSYELVVPYEHKNSLFKIMREELVRLFPQYKAEVEEERKVALVLTVEDLSLLSNAKMDIDTEIYVKELGMDVRNATLSRVVGELNRSGLMHLPITNQTNYFGKVDLQITADMRDVDAVNTQLARYGLKLVDGFRLDRKLIISDNI